MSGDTSSIDELSPNAEMLPQIRRFGRNCHPTSSGGDIDGQKLVGFDNRNGPHLVLFRSLP